MKADLPFTAWVKTPSIKKKKKLYLFIYKMDKATLQEV